MAIVTSDGAVTLLGAGAVGPEDLALALARAPRLVAADGGAATALAAGHRPEAVIGDLDSLKPEDRERLPAARVHRLAEQESTDFDKALRSIDAPLVLGVGFLGRRLDHQLAAMTVLVRQAARRCVLIGEEDVAFAAPPLLSLLSLDLEAGARVSLFPLGAVKGRSEGLAWPIDGLAFAPDCRIGTSNRATGPVRLAFDRPGMIVILPRAALDIAIAALWAPGGSLVSGGPRVSGKHPL